MNTRNRILIAGALIASASALGAQAANQDAFFDQQRQISDGYYPQYTVHPTARSAKPATLHQSEEDDWLTRERAMGSGIAAPVPVPVPSTKPITGANSEPTPTARTANNSWWAQERDRDDGYAFPAAASITGGR